MKEFKIQWHDDDFILVKIASKGLVEFECNKSGLITLSNLMREYAENAQKGDEFHCFARSSGLYNGILADKSMDLSIIVVEKSE